MKRRSNNNSQRILIVEDSPAQALYLEHLLRTNGYSVSVAPRGADALAAIDQEHPSAVVTDIVMPEMDGYQLCQQIKEDVALRDIPVVLLTVLASPEDVIRSLQCGADGRVLKFTCGITPRPI